MLSSSPLLYLDKTHVFREEIVLYDAEDPPEEDETTTVELKKGQEVRGQ